MTERGIHVEGSDRPDIQEPRAAPARPVPAPMWGVVGALVGALVTVALTSDRATETATTDSMVAPSAVPGTAPDRSDTPVDLGTLAPALSVDLIGVGTVDGNPTMQQWALTDAAPVALSHDPGRASTDLSNIWLAVSTPRRFGLQAALWAGTAGYVEPISAASVGAVWRADAPAEIAWVEDEPGDPGRAELRTRSFVDGSSAVVTRAPIPGRSGVPVWFTGAGITLLGPDGALTLWDRSEGAPLARLEVDEFLAAADRHALVIRDAEALLIDPFLDVVAAVDLDLTGCFFGSFAPPVDRDTQRMAFVCQHPEGQIFLHAWQLQVVAVDPGTAIVKIDRMGSQPQLTPASFEWADPGTVVSPLPINADAPETLVTVWDVEANDAIRFSWPGLIDQVIPVAR